MYEISLLSLSFDWGRLGRESPDPPDELDVFDEPMIYFPIASLAAAGVTMRHPIQIIDQAIRGSDAR